MTQVERENLAASHLESALHELESDARKGRYNIFCIRDLGNVAQAVGQNSLAKRAGLLLRDAPDEAFWAGAITNFPIPAMAPERLRSLATAEELTKLYPPFREEQTIQYIRSLAANERHIEICLEGRFHEARQIAGSGLKLEEVGSSLAVIGEFEAVRGIASDPALEPFRRRGVQLVLVIELFRRGLSDDAMLILAELERAGVGPWDRIHLATGIAGRLPWDGYPFPDW